MLDPSQICTLVDCLAELVRDETCGRHMLGAMQSGKTTTAFALLWAASMLTQIT